MNNSNYIINLLLKDNGLPSKIKALQRNFETLDESLKGVITTIDGLSSKLSKELGQIGSSAEKTGQSIKKSLEETEFVNLTIMAQNLSEGFKTLTGSGSSFEQSMANLSATTGIAGKDLDELNRIARETGIASGAGATEAANAFAQLATEVKVSKVGLEGLKTLQQETVTLAQAGGIGMTEAAGALAGTVNQFGLGADQANRVVNVLAAGARAGSASITDLAASLKTSGEAAAQNGISVEQAAGALEALSNNNLKGAEAGTALSGILTSMQEKLNIDLSQTGLSAALESLQPMMGNTAELTRIFGESNAGAAEYLITNATSVAQMTTALTDTNTAQEQAATRTQTTAEKMKQMQAAIDDAKITIYDSLGGFSGYATVITENLVAVSQLVPLITLMSKGFSMLKTSNAAAAGATDLSTASTLKATVASTAHAIQQKVVATATTVWATAQKALNAVMNANPIALVVTAITALVGGIVVAYQNFDGFRKIVDSAWEGIKNLGSAIWDGLVKAFEKVSSVLQPIWDKLKTLMGIEEEVTATTQAATTAIDNYGKANEQAGTATGQLNDKIGEQNSHLKVNLNTLGGIEQKISELRAKQKTASTEQAIEIEKEIRLLEKKKGMMENSIMIGAAEAPDMKPLEAGSIPLLNVVNPKNAGEGINLPVMVDDEDLQKKADQIREKMQSMVGQGNMFAPFQQGLSGIAGIMQNLSGVVGESAGAWLTWGSSLLQSIAQAIPQIIALTNTQVASAISQVSDNAAVAQSGAMASVASIPIVGWIMAGVALASVVATLATIPKPKPMATGGIVYGNTFAQVGEYPGAANNPEVIAPLSKLRSMIEPMIGGGGGTVEFTIKGNRLVGVLNKESNKGKYF